MKTLSFIIITIIGSVSLHAQNFNGQVFDAKTNEPIPYVNIGIVNKGVGTISSENGKFSLKLDDKYKDDTLRISMIGYKYISLKVQDAKSKYGSTYTKFYLEENINQLSEVIIRPIKYKTTIVGNKCLGQPGFSFGADTTKQIGGVEVGTLIHIKKRSTYIDNISFGVCTNDYDSMTIRLNIYDEKTNENLLKHPIYVTVKKGDKVVTVDTKKYNINATDDFIIAFEAIDIPQNKIVKGIMTGKRFLFSGGFWGSDLLMRTNIYDKWKKIPVLVVGFNATITYQDDGNWFTNFFK